MELKEQLEIVDVTFEDSKKATIIFLDEEMGEIREVNFNKQKYKLNMPVILTRRKTMQIN